MTKLKLLRMVVSRDLRVGADTIRKGEIITVAGVYVRPAGQKSWRRCKHQQRVTYERCN